MSIERYSIAGVDYFIHLDDNGAHVKYSDYAELERLLSAEQNKLIDSECHVADLERQRDALVSESAALKVAVREFNQELYGQGFQVVGWHLNGDTEPLDSWFEDNNWNPETPATDAALREIGAKAVEKARDDMQKGGNLTFGECYVSLTNSAQQLREGKV